MKIKRVSLIEPAPRELSMWNFIKQPRLGLVILATILRNKGYDTRVFCESMSPIDWDYVYSSDLCGISCLTQTINPGYLIADNIRKKKIPVIMGGPHVTFAPEEALKHCDFVVRGEGDNSFIELLEALKENKPFKRIRGISFSENGRIVNNPFAKIVDINKLPSPDLSLVKGYTDRPRFDFHIWTGIVSTSRGCPFNCDFCSVIKMFGRCYRQRSVTNIIKDMKEHIKVRKPGNMLLADDNFVVDKEKTKELLREIIKNNFRMRLTIQMRASSANDEEFVRLMRKAGIAVALIGFESINEKTLSEYNKGQDLNEMIGAIKNLKKHGIHIHGMFVLGSDSDKPDVVRKTLNFCLENDIDTIQLLPMTALLGTDLMSRIKRENRLIPADWDLYDTQHANVLFKNIRPSFLTKEIIRAYKKFYSFRRALIQLSKGNKYAFYCAFFGKLLMMGPISKSLDKYIKFLEEYESGKYSGNRLIPLLLGILAIGWLKFP